MTFRNVLIAVGVGVVLQKGIPNPHGPAEPWPEHLRPKHPPVDKTNDSLMFKHGKLSKIYERVEQGQERLLKGPETVVFDNDGTLYTLTEEAKLLKLDDFQQKSDFNFTARVTEVLHLGVGRPLGGEFAPDGTLYVADAHLGLLRVPHPVSEGNVEMVASRVWDADRDVWSPILYCNDLAVGPNSGKVYFSDASDIAPDRLGTRTWDTMYMAKLDLARGRPSGRLLMYDPDTEKVSILASGLWFANGVAVDKDETFVMVSETFMSRAVKYHLSGPKEGQVEVMNAEEPFPGYSDGADCSWTTGLCYTPLPTPIVKFMKIVGKIKHPYDVPIRNLLMVVPRWMTPEVDPYGGIVELFPGNDKVDPHVTQIIQDPYGTDIGMLTGTTVHKDKLYLGSLRNDYIGVYDLL